ncbi:MAG: hypothetical protein ACRESR_08290 [Gammaproteobacteria bacterium]
MLLAQPKTQAVYFAVLYIFIGAAALLVGAMRNSWYLLAHELT